MTESRIGSASNPSLLAGLPQHRLRQLGRGGPDGVAQIPALPHAVIRALCFARSVDEEIDALTVDLPATDAALVRARWGYRTTAEAVAELARHFDMTQAAVQRIVRARVQCIRRSGLVLPLASAAVQDLQDAGGVLSTEDYLILLKYSQVEISANAVLVLPELYALGCTPVIRYLTESDEWLDQRAVTRFAAAGRFPPPLPAPIRSRADQLRRALFDEP